MINNLIDRYMTTHPFQLLTLLLIPPVAVLILLSSIITSHLVESRLRQELSLIEIDSRDMRTQQKALRIDMNNLIEEQFRLREMMRSVSRQRN